MRSSESFGLNTSEHVMTADNSTKNKNKNPDIVALNGGTENGGRAVT